MKNIQDKRYHFLSQNITIIPMGKCREADHNKKKIRKAF